VVSPWREQEKFGKHDIQTRKGRSKAERTLGREEGRRNADHLTKHQKRPEVCQQKSFKKLQKP